MSLYVTSLVSPVCNYDGPVSYIVSRQNKQSQKLRTVILGIHWTRISITKYLFKQKTTPEVCYGGRFIQIQTETVVKSSTDSLFCTYVPAITAINKLSESHEKIEMIDGLTIHDIICLAAQLALEVQQYSYTYYRRGNNFECYTNHYITDTYFSIYLLGQ